MKRCYHSHPALPLTEGMEIYGGSCLDPEVLDADVYIGFDSGMRFTKRHFPWNEGEEVLYRIFDRKAPENIPQFDKLLDWTVEQLKAGKKVHAGCVGGHGRTGLFLAALYFKMSGDKDAIKYVRENYCAKAVESVEQVKFLVSQYGMSKAPATDKEHKHETHKGGRSNIIRSGPPILTTTNIWSKDRP